MAKTTKKTEETKASKPEKKVTAKPVLLAQPDSAPQEAPKVEKRTLRDKAQIELGIVNKFEEINKALNDLKAVKQPRKLRWAIKTLAMAREAAVRAVTYSE